MLTAITPSVLGMSDHKSFAVVDVISKAAFVNKSFTKISPYADAAK